MSISFLDIFLFKFQAKFFLNSKIFARKNVIIWNINIIIKFSGEGRFVTQRLSAFRTLRYVTMAPKFLKQFCIRPKPSVSNL